MPVVMSEQLEVQLRKLFINTSHRSDWLEDDILQVYIRKTYRVIKGQHVWTIDIANVTILPQHQGKGYFGALIQKIEQLIRELRPDIQGIYIENVLFEWLRRHLVKIGFEPVASSGWKHGVMDCF